MCSAHFMYVAMDASGFCTRCSLEYVSCACAIQSRVHVVEA